MHQALLQWLAQHGAFDASQKIDWLLLAVCYSIVLLTLMTLCFALIAICLRISHYARERKWQALKTRWEASILDVLCGDQKASDYHALIDAGRELDFLRFLTPYAYRLRGTDLQILSELARPFLPLLEKRLEHRNPGVRAWALNALGLFGMPQHEESIARMLTDSSPAVVMVAADILLSHEKISYIPTIFESFHHFQKWNTNALANLLVRAGSKAIPVLEKLYVDETQPARTRIIAAEALGLCNAYSSIDSALLLLGSETDRDVLVATLNLLSHISHGRYIDSIRILCKSSDDVLRIAAMRTLRSLATHGDIGIFRRGLTDTNPWVARHAAMALHDLGDIKTLTDTAEDPLHPRSTMAQQILAGMA